MLESMEKMNIVFLQCIWYFFYLQLKKDTKRENKIIFHKIINFPCKNSWHFWHPETSQFFLVATRTAYHVHKTSSCRESHQPLDMHRQAKVYLWRKFLHLSRRDKCLLFLLATRRHLSCMQDVFVKGILTSWTLTGLFLKQTLTSYSSRNRLTFSSVVNSDISDTPKQMNFSFWSNSDILDA